MKILFTKENIDKKLIFKNLGDRFSYDFQEVIRIEPIRVSSFNLKNKSIIFTSVNAVESFFKNGFKVNENFTEKSHNRIYCVGEKTKKALRKYGLGTYKIKRDARELCEFIIENSHREKFLHFCGNLALDVLNNELPLQYINYEKIIVYNTVLLYPRIDKGYDAVVFFSPSGVRSFAEHNDFSEKTIFSIGRTTEKEIKKYTFSPVITSEQSNLEDLVKKIKAFYSL